MMSLCHPYVNFSLSLQKIENWEWLIYQIDVLPFRGTGEMGREKTDEAEQREMQSPATSTD